MIGSAPEQEGTERGAVTPQQTRGLRRVRIRHSEGFVSLRVLRFSALVGSPIKSLSRLWSFTWLLAWSGAAFSAATCLRIEDEIPRSLQTVWNVPAERIAVVRDAHRRLSTVTGLSPKLELCGTDDVNAGAVDEQPQRIQINTAMLLVTDKADELAAIIAHEFAHLLMLHRAKEEENFRQARRNGIALGRAELERGATISKAIRDANLSIALETSSFSRVAEREADDVGIKLASRAGYDPRGAASFAVRLLNAGVPAQTGFLSSHPGWGERAWYSARMAANENFRAEAVAEVNAHDAVKLSKTVAAWKASAPDSGGAAYYGAYAAVFQHRPAGDVSAELENAVDYFALDADSVMGAEYATEAADASISLCLSLYREGRLYPALNCVKHLPTEKVREFRRVSGWSGFLVLGRSEEVSRTIVFGAHAAQQPIKISTCQTTAEQEGLIEVRPWAALREPHVAAFRVAQAPLACDPTLCACSPITLNNLTSQSWILPY